jgi:hypothetical protein
LARRVHRIATMKRALFVMVVGLGMGLMGCANDVEDPVPQQPAPEVQRDPPSKALGTQLRDPQELLIVGAAITERYDGVPAEQKIPAPQPIPE